ncbi:MAG: chorismate synthase [Oscillospiraceae bacterium]|jgi:chorismate synthase|nr:chorismate synthase [Oscillospiraceae bacterium]
MSSHWGNCLHISIFGQSHAPAIGVTLDNLPAGQPIDLEALHAFLARRAPGRGPTSTPRKEADQPEILCGLVNGFTCGAPLSAVIRNTNTRSQDYENLRDMPRPGHADYTAQIKYRGFQDLAGGGHFSGRLTAPLCIAGGICLQILKRQGVTVHAHIQRIGRVEDRPFDPLGEGDLGFLPKMPLPVLRPEAASAMEAEVLSARQAGDSVGGVVECMVQGLPAGVGSPMLESLESRIASLLFGVPAVKGVEFGAGFAAAGRRGSENNDRFVRQGDQVRTASNHSGGILGGISSGMPVVFRAAFKPTPSIAAPQNTLRLSTGQQEILNVRGRHDPCIVPRAVPVVEAAAAIAVLDAWMETKSLEGFL